MISFQQIKQQKTLILSFIALCVLISFFLGIVFLPSIFYDQFIWKYFWGPVVEDALNKPVSYNGIPAAQKFTLISELIYGLYRCPIGLFITFNALSHGQTINSIILRIKNSFYPLYICQKRQSN